MKQDDKHISYIALSGLSTYAYFKAGLRPTFVYSIPSGLVLESPEEVKYDKDGRCPSTKTQTEKSPVRAI